MYANVLENQQSLLLSSLHDFYLYQCPCTILELDLFGESSMTGLYLGLSWGRNKAPFQMSN